MFVVNGSVGIVFIIGGCVFVGFGIGGFSNMMFIYILEILFFVICGRLVGFFEFGW